MPIVALIALLGVVAGVLTTIAGLGGGLLLMVALSLILGPKAALAATAPALLVGNSHRAYLYRQLLQRHIAGRFALGALPGSLLGGLLVVAVPPSLLQGTMLAMTVLALLRLFGWARFSAPPVLLTPMGFAIGLLTATAGGAGVLTGPTLIAAGLRGTTYIATAACSAATMHVGRLASYGVAGLMNTAVWRYAALLTVCVLLGNVLGHRLRAHIPERRATLIEGGALVLCVVLSLLGLGRS